MFRADSRSVQLGKHLAYEFAGGLALVLLVGAAVSWGLGWRLSKPLTELTERLRGISQRKSQVRLGPQPLAELEAVAREFNQMAERLEQYDKLNVERLVYEKSKTEAIIESLEDGVVLIDTEGIVAHINEIASLILGVDPAGRARQPVRRSRAAIILTTCACATRCARCSGPAPTAIAPKSIFTFAAATILTC